MATLDALQLFGVSTHQNDCKLLLTLA